MLSNHSPSSVTFFPTVPMPKAKRYYYSVVKGRKIGIFTTEKECRKHTDDFIGTIHKRCESLEEATDFLNQHYDKISRKQSKKPIRPSVPSTSSSSLVIKKEVIVIDAPQATVSKRPKKNPPELSLVPTSNVYIARRKRKTSVPNPYDIWGYGIFWSPGHINNVSKIHSGRQGKDFALFQAAVDAIKFCQRMWPQRNHHSYCIDKFYMYRHSL